MTGWRTEAGALPYDTTCYEQKRSLSGAARLNTRYTNAGSLHLTGAGCLRWVAFLRQNHWMK